jgi:hypothetical protein
MLMAILNQQSLLSFQRFSCSFERFAQKDGISQIMKNTKKPANLCRTAKLLKRRRIGQLNIDSGKVTCLIGVGQKSRRWRWMLEAQK